MQPTHNSASARARSITNTGDAGDTGNTGRRRLFVSILQQSDLLNQIGRNTKLKDSFQLILSGNKSEFTIRNEAPSD
jgi:hypothetical protein